MFYVLLVYTIRYHFGRIYKLTQLSNKAITIEMRTVYVLIFAQKNGIFIILFYSTIIQQILYKKSIG